MESKNLKNDEAFAKLMSIEKHYSPREYFCIKQIPSIFDNLQLLKNTTVIIGGYYLTFDEDYIESTLPQRIKENYWELLNKGLISRKHF